jgi:ribosome biogenesis GTPase
MPLEEWSPRFTSPATRSSRTRGVEVTATLAKELRKDGCVTCDRVALDGDVTGAKGSLARIVTIDERSSVLTRAAEDGEEVEQTIVANADQLVIVMACCQSRTQAKAC